MKRNKRQHDSNDDTSSNKVSRHEEKQDYKPAATVARASNAASDTAVVTNLSESGRVPLLRDSGKAARHLVKEYEPLPPSSVGKPPVFRQELTEQPTNHQELPPVYWINLDSSVQRRRAMKEDH